MKKSISTAERVCLPSPHLKQCQYRMWRVPQLRKSIENHSSMYSWSFCNELWKAVSASFSSGICEHFVRFGRLMLTPEWSKQSKHSYNTIQKGINTKNLNWVEQSLLSSSCNIQMINSWGVIVTSSQWEIQEQHTVFYQVISGRESS